MCWLQVAITGTTDNEYNEWMISWLLCVVRLHEMKAYFTSDTLRSICLMRCAITRTNRLIIVSDKYTFLFSCVFLCLFCCISLISFLSFSLQCVLFLSVSFQSSCKPAIFSISYSKVYNFRCLLSSNDNLTLGHLFPGNTFSVETLLAFYAPMQLFRELY